MKFLRHILSHLILISFLIALVSAFYYRTLLFPSDVVVKVDGITKKIFPPALAFVSKRDYFWSIRGERIVSFDDLNIFDKNEEPASEAKVTEIAKIEPQKSSETESQNVAKVETEAKPEVEAKKIDVVIDENTPAKDPVIASVIVDKPLQEVIVKELIEPTEVKDKNAGVPVAIKDNDKELPVVVKDSDTSSERDLLISARSAFNQGDVLGSEKFYIQLTELDHDNADIFGELGNVYYSQGKWDKAGQAYYEAAIRLIIERKHEQVNYLQHVISGLNTEYAEKLAQRMSRR